MVATTELVAVLITPYCCPGWARTTVPFRAFVEAGGLMSYAPNQPHVFRRCADYVDKILRGTKPGDIPVEQPIKFDLVINLTTAKALGLEVPSTLLARADEVIE
jgi:putative ABC transport system substrate-binding protein